jgi:hypothetical protein
MEAIIFPDAEDAVRAYLAGRVDASVYTAILPPQLPDKSVTITRTGGVERDIVTDEPMLSIDCRSNKGSVAERLAASVRSWLGVASREGRLGDVTLYEVVEVSGPYFNPDPVNPTQQRYTAIYRIALRGAVT